MAFLFCLFRLHHRKSEQAAGGIGGSLGVKSLSEKPYERHPYAAYTDA